MKKFLAIVLVICTLLTSCLAFSSCGKKVSQKDVEKDPQAVLGEAIQNTNSLFFTDDAKLEDVLKKLNKGGAITVSFECETLLGELDIDQISETIYVNKDGDRIVSDTLVKYNGEDLSARIFMDKNGVILNSESVFGNSTSYALNLSTFASNFASSDLAKSMGLPEETVAEVTEVINQIKTEYEKLFDEDNKEAEALANEMLALLNQTVVTEKIVGEDGKKVNCVIVTYSITNATLKAMADKMAAEVQLPESAKEEFVASLNNAIEELNEIADVNINTALYINRKTATIEKIEMKGDVTPKGDVEDKCVIDGKITFSETQVAFLINATVGTETPATIDVKITKEEKDGVYTYALVANATMNEANVTATANVLNAKYTYNKSTGDFEITADVMRDEENRFNLGLKGKITSDKKKATIEVNSVSYGEETVACKLTVTLDSEAEIPAAPTDAKDIVTLTESDIEALLEGIQNSKLGKLLFGSAY